MTLFEYLQTNFPEANCVLRSDSCYTFIFVDDQALPVGYLTSNKGVQAEALFAFDSLHRWPEADCMFLGLFHCLMDAEQYFVEYFKKQPIYKSHSSLGITDTIRGYPLI